MTRRSFVKTSLAANAAAAIGQEHAASVRFVRRQGKNLVGPDGQRLQLRGINLGNWLEPEGYMFLFEEGPASPREIEAFFNELIGPAAAEEFWKKYRQQYITKADIDLVRSSGFNSVRIPFHYKFFLSENEGFGLLDAAVAWCRQAKIWIILDMHCAPGGQTGTNIDDSWGYPWLFESQQDQELTIEVWRRIARHYRDEPIIIGYDLLNEPIPHYPQLLKYNSQLEPLYRRITKAIREVDKNHIIILGGAQWDSNFKVFGPPFDSNVVYQFHKYWTSPTKDVIQEYLDYRDRYNVPVWLGESGENTDEWIQQFVRVLGENKIGWCFWPYKKMEKSSCVVSIPKPAHWDEIVAFAKLPGGTGSAEKRIAARPSLEHSRQALEDLLDKIRLEKCRVNSGYLKALGVKQPSF
ncbi:MAG: glycoside hydrolase family 5 protein [Acidobacteriaceae bacterium]|nr:glycoside hydrolase family 5 protein [Acidobacteriaceae bacterium]MBV9780217.1 glycoside hydrolase family 5 protein [Acidobacteriaceae bacterium]